MGFRRECWWLILVVVVTEVTATPLNSPTNNYRVLANHQVWEVSDKAAVKVLLDMEKEGLVDVLGHSRATPSFRVYPRTLSAVSSVLDKAGIRYKVLISDLASTMEERHKARTDNVVDRLEEESCTKNSCPSPLINNYMSFKQMEWYLKQLAASSPRVKLKSIGKSYEGRKIWMAHVTSSTDKGKGAVTKKGGAKRNAIWIEGGIHAREWISSATALHTLQRIVDDETLTDLDCFIVPMANPDGYEYSRTGDRMWRKNRRLNEGSECVGVDLNRNWNEAYGVGASSDPCSSTYMGTEPFSEPETRALMKEMVKVNKKYNLRLMLAMHSYGQKLLYPYGSNRALPSDTPRTIAVGKIFADTIQEYDNSVYEVENSGRDFYYASGATDDWTKAKLKADLSYTLELKGGGALGFDLPPGEIKTTTKEVWMGLKKVISFIDDNLKA